MTPLDRKVEQLIQENATDFEMATILKADIKAYFDTLPELFSQSSGKDFSRIGAKLRRIKGY